MEYMAGKDDKEKVRQWIAEAKRKCIMCNGRRKLRPTDTERNKAFELVEKLYNYFLFEFNELRRTDAPIEAINLSRENKGICLNAMDSCNKCDKEIDRINREMNRLK